MNCRPTWIEMSSTQCIPNLPASISTLYSFLYTLSSHLFIRSTQSCTGSVSTLSSYLQTLSTYYLHQDSLHYHYLHLHTIYTGTIYILSTECPKKNVVSWKNGHNYLQTYPKCKRWGCFGKFMIFATRWALRFSKLKKK